MRDSLENKKKPHVEFFFVQRGGGIEVMFSWEDPIILEHDFFQRN